MSRVVAIIQARISSSRLPGKALLALAGRPMLAHVIERVLATPGLDEVVLATSVSIPDEALMAVATSYGIRTWRGSESDVLGRFQQAAQWADADIIMRVTADCPLFAPDVAALVLALYEAQRRFTSGTYAWNDTAHSGWPDGMDVEVFDRELLDLAASSTSRVQDRAMATPNTQQYREHVTPPIRRLAKEVLTLAAPRDLSRLKLSVDCAQDLETVRRVAQYLDGDLRWPATAQACVLAGLIEQQELER